MGTRPAPRGRLRANPRSRAVGRRPREGSVSLGAVVRATEDGFDLVECFDPARNRCVLTPACGLRGPLDEALLAFLAALDRYSLADLVANPGQMRKMRRILAEDRSAP